MNYTRNDTSKAAVLAAASALVILLAGCQSATTAPPDSYISNSSPNSNQSEEEPGSPQKTYSEQSNNEKVTEEPHMNSADITSGTNAETSTLHKTDDAKAAVKTESGDAAAWTVSAPMLHGLAIGDSDSKVKKLFGNEIDSYTLEEETESIQVLEYDGFAVGVNDHKTVHYIEVYGNNISAGLSGLQIGDKPDKALRTLGKPEKQTAYLLAYQAQGALLKLDLDPDHNEIVSIKLLTLS